MRARLRPWCFVVIGQEELEAHFRDDCLAAALLSESAAGFVEACGPRIVRGDFDLLARVTHVLRVACKESPQWLDEPGLPSQMFVPKGAGWAPTLRLVLDLIDEFLPERWQFVLGLVEDWAGQVEWWNPAPEGLSEAGAIMDRLLAEFKGYGSEDARERTLKVAVKIPGAVAQFKDLMERARTCSHDDLLAFGLLDLVLMKPGGAFVCLEFPDEVIALLDARLRLSDADRERERSYMGWSIEVDADFGIRRGLPMGSYHPPSALRGPFFALLRYHPRKGLAFILSFLNHAGRSYATGGQWLKRRLEPAWKTSLAVPNRGIVEQWANGQLYGLYRGSTVGPDSIVSMLMALERWLLFLGKEDDVDLENQLMHLLENSNNVMATGVVASVCLAYPDKVGQAGLALLSSRGDRRARPRTSGAGGQLRIRDVLRAQPGPKVVRTGTGGVQRTTPSAGGSGVSGGENAIREGSRGGLGDLRPSSGADLGRIRRGYSVVAVGAASHGR